MAKVAAARFVRLRSGLVEPQHIQAMGGGSPFVLYVWLHLHVRFSGPGAGTSLPDAPYHHDDAALALGEPRTSVRRWFKTLVDAGYITTTRGRYGLAVTITKYTSPDCPPMDTLTTARLSTNGQSQELQSVHPWTPECPPMDTQPQERARETLKQESQEISPTGIASARALAPHQLLINAYLEAMGRNPQQVGKGYGRYVQTGVEMAARPDTPQDVGNCTRYLMTDPWRQEKGRPPSLEDVRDALPMWIDRGRPAKCQPGVNGTPRSASSRMDRLIEEASHGRGQGTDGGSGAGAAGLGVPQVRRGVPPVLPG